VCVCVCVCVMTHQAKSRRFKMLYDVRCIQARLAATDVCVCVRARVCVCGDGYGERAERADAITVVSAIWEAEGKRRFETEAKPRDCSGGSAAKRL
jgi:hypothetical protein